MFGTSDYDEARIIARNMQEHGGSFVRALGLALEKADGDNTRRIKAAFPEYWAKYNYKR